MYCRAAIIVAAGMWPVALSAQTAPQRPAVLPNAPAVRSEAERALRELVKRYGEGETGVCSIALREVPVPRNREEMPVLRPRMDNLEPMPVAKMPAPPCKEDKR